MTDYYRIFLFDNSGSYDSLLKDISFDNSGSYDCLLQDISSITQAHMTCLLQDISFRQLRLIWEVITGYFLSTTQAHMRVY